MLINTILIQRTIERQELWAQLKPEDFRALTPPAGAKDRAELIRALSGIMRELGYQSGSIDPANEKLPAIEGDKLCVS